MDHNSTTTSNFRHCPFFPGKVGPASGRVVFATEQQLLNQATRGCYSTCREARKKLAFILPPKTSPDQRIVCCLKSVYLTLSRKKCVVTPRSLDLLWSYAIPPPLEMPRSRRLLLEVPISQLLTHYVPSFACLHWSYQVIKCLPLHFPYETYRDFSGFLWLYIHLKGKKLNKISLPTLHPDKPSTHNGYNQI